ncbi:MAG: hypothetical protein QOH81_2770 [Sphingomonadales bacterium]|jgi:SAM-dependent methyltransferase|nr:hypothetical protein [Sphingomonadales bacterium]
MMKLLRLLNQISATRFGLRAVRTGHLYRWQTEPGRAGTVGTTCLPDGASIWLRRDNPVLVDLVARYAAFDSRVIRPVRWTPDKLSDRDLLWFRGDNAFLWQVRGLNLNPLAYALCYYHFLASDEGRLLDRLGEDDLFGVHLFEFNDRPVSRDLLDSAGEIQFLQRHLGLGSNFARVLDIGAGYGRLAWRLEQVFGQAIQVFATDAFAPATFICDYYLRFRGARTAVVPVDEVDALLSDTPIDLAINVHSFSECSPEAVDWWVERLSAHRVRHLFIVPNAGTKGGFECQAADGINIEPIVARHGYRLVACEARYSDPFVQEHGIDPVAFHLFELR